jgi:hypothetical protein
MYDPPPLTARPERSCLIKDSSGSSDRIGDKKEPATRHVTVLSCEDLPSYSSERYFLLSEVEIQAHSTLFLCDYYPSRYSNATTTADADNSTQETEMEDDDLSDSHNNNDEDPEYDTQLPPFCLLYLLWKPDMDYTAEEYAEKVIVPVVVDQIQNIRVRGETVQLVNSLLEQQKYIFASSSTPRRACCVGTISPSRNSFKETGSDEARSTRHQTETSESEPDDSSTNAIVQLDQPPQQQQRHELQRHQQQMSIYLVVDRLVASGPRQQQEHDTDPLEWTIPNDQFLQGQEQIIEELARKVATHEQLRGLCEGITVGVSNDMRAAPGLEACSNSFTIGTRDRRRFTQSQSSNATSPRPSLSGRSLLGLITGEPEDLLGLKPNETDAAQSVFQRRVSAEWKGLGTLTSFAERAHVQWKRQAGIDTSDINSARKKSVKSEMSSAGDPLEPQLDELTVNRIAMAVIVSFMLFHLRKESPDLFWFLDLDQWVDAIHRLR